MKSMTGFAKKQFEIDGKTYSIEIRTLNSKQLDINTRLTPIFREKDLDIRAMLNVLLRGKIDFSITEDIDKSQGVSELNRETAKKHYMDCLELYKEFGLNSDHLMEAVLRLSDVWQTSDVKELTDDAWAVVVQNLEKAIADVEEFRQREGEILKKDFIYRVKLIEETLDKVEPYEKERIDTVKERIRKYFSDVELAVDENRFEQELIYYLEKFDVTEEKVRLRKHIDYFNEVMAESDAVGKKLSFVVQEIGREINTLGSKANHADIQRLVVDMKDELEKIKEQLGNIL